MNTANTCTNPICDNSANGLCETCAETIANLAIGCERFERSCAYGVCRRTRVPGNIVCPKHSGCIVVSLGVYRAPYQACSERQKAGGVYYTCTLEAMSNGSCVIHGGVDKCAYGCGIVHDHDFCATHDDDEKEIGKKQLTDRLLDTEESRRFSRNLILRPKRRETKGNWPPVQVSSSGHMSPPSYPCQPAGLPMTHIPNFAQPVQAIVCNIPGCFKSNTFVGPNPYPFGWRCDEHLRLPHPVEQNGLPLKCNHRDCQRTIEYQKTMGFPPLWFCDEHQEVSVAPFPAGESTTQKCEMNGCDKTTTYFTGTRPPNKWLCKEHTPFPSIQKAETSTIPCKASGCIEFITWHNGLPAPDNWTCGTHSETNKKQSHCGWCGMPCKTDATFCSPHCASAYTPSEIQCGWCGTKCMGGNGRKYCSDECENQDN